MPNPPGDEDERFAIVRRLLHDDELDLADRFAGGVLLLYGSSLTRIAALPTTVVGLDAGGTARLILGRGAVPLPEPLGAIALALKDRRLTQAGSGTWLLPGRHAVSTSPPTPSEPG